MTHPYTREYFEDGTISSYQGYKDNREFYLLAKEIYTFFAPRRTLEIGCAKGFVVKHLRLLGVEAYGVDISSYAIDKAPRQIKPYLTVAHAKKIPFKTGDFDLVYSLDVLEHIDAHEISEVISELLRVSKRQFHLITTHELKPGKDKTHVTLRPISWWKKQFKLGSTSKHVIFLLPSENHWIHDFIHWRWQQQRKIATLTKRNNTLQIQLAQILDSRGWKITVLLHKLRMNLPLLRGL